MQKSKRGGASLRLRASHRFVCIATKIISCVKDFLCKLSLMVKDAALAMMLMRMCAKRIAASAYRRMKRVWLRPDGKQATVALGNGDRLRQR